MIDLVFLSRKSVDSDLDGVYSSLLQRASYRVNELFCHVPWNNCSFPIFTYSIKVCVCPIRRIKQLHSYIGLEYVTLSNVATASPSVLIFVCEMYTLRRLS
jgi:hypothetical protein